MTKGSGDARAQPLFFLITTAGTDIHSICYEQHQKAKDIISNRKIDPTFYPVIYGAQEDDDWTSPEVWKKANPSLGHTIDIEKVEVACESARQTPQEENVFRQLRLNQWVKQSVRWMPMERWDQCDFAVDIKGTGGASLLWGTRLIIFNRYYSFCLVFLQLMKKINIGYYPTFGYRKRQWNSELGEIEFLMIFGTVRVLCKQLKVM